MSLKPNKYYGKAKKRGTGEMNRTEKAYEARLKEYLAAGEILEYKFEPLSLRLAPGCFYQPDFMVIDADKTVQFVEVKGPFIHDQKSIVKLKTASELFPFRFILAQLTKEKIWNIKEIGRE